MLVTSSILQKPPVSLPRHIAQQPPVHRLAPRHPDILWFLTPALGSGWPTAQMPSFFGVTWLSITPSNFASLPPTQESSFNFFLSLTIIHLFSKIISCAYCVPAPVLNLGKRGDKGRWSPVLAELAFAFRATDKKQKSGIMNAMKGEKNRIGYRASDLGWQVQSSTLNEVSREDLTEEVAFHKKELLLEKSGTRPRAHVVTFFWSL